mmetsp:Transcript_30407/g.80832  ORF Transcript_30407/g.80832 Transcript_30407/m.80832 type:complete len:108 (+) Transcript_30407:710-1033(+)
MTKSIQTRNAAAISMLYSHLNERVFGVRGPADELKEFLGSVDIAGSGCLLHRVFDQQFQSGLVPPNSAKSTLAHYPFTCLGVQELNAKQRFLLYGIASLRSFDYSLL